MKLVIDISEELYEEVKFKISRSSTEGFNPLTIIVGNGTPLSESEDCVSRQAVLEALRTVYDTHIIETEDGDEYIDYNDMVYEIEQLPPVNPTEKVGQWITVDKGLKVTSYKCSECGRIVRDDTDYDVIKDYPYCHCGAKMGGMEKDNTHYDEFGFIDPFSFRKDKKNDD